MPETTIHLNGKKPYEFDVQANQLSDILCRGATVSSVQSTNNTLTRNSTLRDTGDYDVPHPHPYTHHYMTTSAAATPQAMSMVGSRPDSASGSGSSPAISGSGSGICSRSIDGLCIGSGNDGTNVGGQMSYLESLHYERMPMAVPIPIVPPPPPQLHSEDEIEPAYATGTINT